jgi:hypothetical protein
MIEDNVSEVELPILSTTAHITYHRPGYLAGGLKDDRTVDLKRLGAIAIYTLAHRCLACVGMFGVSATDRVLRTGAIHVDQFYCSLAFIGNIHSIGDCFTEYCGAHE